MNKSIFLIVLLVPFLIGCKQLKWVGDKIFEPITSQETTHTNRIAKVPEITVLPDGTAQTNLVDQLQPVKLITTHTNGWKLRTGIERTIHVAGDVVPFPWSSLASNALIATLGGVAAFRGKKWKKAATSAVQSADKWRQVVKSIDPEKDKTIKAEAIKEQRASGTIDLISDIVKKVLK